LQAELQAVLDAKVRAEQSKQPIADPSRRPEPGFARGKYKMADDFDAPLPDEFWLGES